MAKGKQRLEAGWNRLISRLYESRRTRAVQEDLITRVFKDRLGTEGKVRVI